MTPYGRRVLADGRIVLQFMIASILLVGCRDDRTPDSPTDSQPTWTVPAPPIDIKFPKEVGRGSPLVRTRGDLLEVWLRGPLEGEGSEWLDVSGAGFVAERFQYGYGADRLPPIETPHYLSGDDDGWSDLTLAETRYGDLRLGDETELVALDFRGNVRAYPLAVLHEHELVLDVLAGVPVAVAY